MPDTLQSLLARPDLPRVARAINEALERERVRREQFRRELTPSVKAEFNGGKTVMHSPAKAKHLRATQNLVGLLRAFVQRHSLGEVFFEKVLICLTRNDYEPDDFAHRLFLEPRSTTRQTLRERSLNCQ